MAMPLLMPLLMFSVMSPSCVAPSPAPPQHSAISVSAAVVGLGRVVNISDPPLPPVAPSFQTWAVVTSEMLFSNGSKVRLAPQFC